MTEPTQAHPAVDLASAPLRGTSLVEASAGTGKTYTIAGLYLRLVVELGLPVDQVLVVTFTEAAVAELKRRLRGALSELRSCFLGHAEPQGLQAALIADGAEGELRRVRLEAALRGFDDAAVHTIHGFCQRALTDAAFECGGAFQTEVLADQEALLQEVVDDYWRRQCYPASSLFAAYLEQEQVEPDRLARELRGLLGKPQARLRGPQPLADPAELEAALTAAWAVLRRSLPVDAAALLSELGDGRLNRRSYPPAELASWLEPVRAYLRRSTPGFKPPEKLAHFGQRKIHAALRKGAGSAPQHPLFSAVDAYLQALDQVRQAHAAKLAALRLELLSWARAELQRRQRERRLLSFDDLIASLRDALLGPSGEPLRGALRRRYAAALIDEFQDTDPSQYQIFDRLFADDQTPLFLVGDPKQAIYGFRGADLFAYLRARRSARQRWSLVQNWRSEPALIQAVNALFQSAPQPFLLAEIGFAPAEPCPRPPPALLEQGRASAPLRLWLLGEGEGKALNKGQAEIQVVAAVAEEVVQLLRLAATGDLRLQGPGDAADGDRGRPLEGGDVAILVRTNAQARAVAGALAARAVACVQLGEESVLESAEAEELEWLLLALADPGHEGLLRAALVTQLLGVRGQALNASLAADGAGFEPHLQAFHELNGVWRERGFMPAFQELLARYGVRGRLLAQVGGERSLTNVLHLAELLEHAARRERLGPAELGRWLSEQRRRGGLRGDEQRALRLETDARLVKVVTVHKSKGLEYPVVFCPFLWDGRELKDQCPAVYHDPREDHALTLDFGSQDFALALAGAGEESRAEDLRLLYVALTRAKNRCYLAWGRVRQAGHAALAWLLHQPSTTEGSTLAALAERYQSLTEAELGADLRRLLERGAGSIALQPLPQPGSDWPPHLAEGARVDRAAPIHRPVEQLWRLASFSALLGGHGGDSLPDRDPVLAPARVGEPLPPGLGPASFPRGAGPGSCLHALLETWDFARGERSELDAVAEQCLASYGIDGVWREPLVEWMGRVVATPLDPAGWALRDLPRSRRVHELEFHYPVLGLEAQGLAERLRRLGGPELSAAAQRLGALGFSLSAGFLRGFVDLIFEQDGRYYVADFKSNWLGPSVEDYRPERLAQSMDEEGYHLQHLLYLLALHRFLRTRLADYDYRRHVGGVLYLYLRGMDPESGAARGVYRVRPAAALVEALDQWLSSP